MNTIIKIGARYQYLMPFIYVLEQEKEAEGQEE